MNGKPCIPYLSPECESRPIQTETNFCGSVEKTFGSTINTVTEEDRNDWI